MKKRCVKLYVPADCCYIEFRRGGRVKRTWGTTYTTCRGEELMLDVNEKREIVGIELIGKKPCQR